MPYKRIEPLMPTVEVRLVYGEGASVRHRQMYRSSDLTEAMALARHALDFEMYLAPLASPPEVTPVAAKIINGDQVVWSLTVAERERERRKG